MKWRVSTLTQPQSHSDHPSHGQDNNSYCPPLLDSQKRFCQWHHQQTLPKSWKSIRENPKNDGTEETHFIIFLKELCVFLQLESEEL